MADNPIFHHFLVEFFDDIRPSFLAGLDQVISEMRPLIGEDRTESIRSCAVAFSDSRLIISQLAEVHPEISPLVVQEEIAEVHLVTLAYLLSLCLHELMSSSASPPPPPHSPGQKEVPLP